MVETKLTAAAVYRSGCIVRRSGKVSLQKGTQTVRIGGLTAGIDDWRSKNAAKAQVRKKIRDTLYEPLPEGLRSDEERAAFEERVYNYYYQLPDAA